SGNPVTASTAVTGMPASSRCFSVPPVDTISYPRSTRAWAKATMSVLSYTLNNARRGLDSLPVTWQFLLGQDVHAPSVHDEAPFRKQTDRLRVKLMLPLLDAGR